MPSAVSWIDAIKGLRYCFLIANHLRQSSRRNHARDSPVIIGQQCGCEFLEGDQFVLADVVLFVLGKAVNEEGPCARPEYNQCPKPTRLPLSRARDPLLDYATSQVGGNQSPFGVPDGIAQHGIADACLLRKANERLVLEYPHLPSPEPIATTRNSV